jgi:hypothetical protein
MAPRWQAGMGYASGLILEPHTYTYLYMNSGKNNIFFEFCFYLAIPVGATGHYSPPGPGNPVPGHRYRSRSRWNNLVPNAPVGAPANNRAPPPTSYTASSPYPPIAVGRGPLSKGSRNCSPPSNGEGNPPNLGLTTWDDGLWRRARAKINGFARLALHPTCSAALAKCRPCDVFHRWIAAPPGPTRMVALIVRSVLSHRPGTPKEDEWKYGTGDGAHNPSHCVSVFHSVPLRGRRRRVRSRRPPQEDYPFLGWHQAHRLGNRSDSPTPRHTAGKGGCFSGPIFCLCHTDSIRCFSSHRCTSRTSEIFPSCGTCAWPS